MQRLRYLGYKEVLEINVYFFIFLTFHHGFKKCFVQMLLKVNDIFDTQKFFFTFFCFFLFWYWNLKMNITFDFLIRIQWNLVWNAFGMITKNDIGFNINLTVATDDIIIRYYFGIEMQTWISLDLVVQC